MSLRPNAFGPPPTGNRLQLVLHAGSNTAPKSQTPSSLAKELRKKNKPQVEKPEAARQAAKARQEAKDLAARDSVEKQQQKLKEEAMRVEIEHVDRIQNDRMSLYAASFVEDLRFPEGNDPLGKGYAARVSLSELEDFVDSFDTEVIKQKIMDIITSIYFAVEQDESSPNYNSNTWQTINTILFKARLDSGEFRSRITYTKRDTPRPKPPSQPTLPKLTAEQERARKADRARRDEERANYPSVPWDPKPRKVDPRQRKDDPKFKGYRIESTVVN